VIGRLGGRLVARLLFRIVRRIGKPQFADGVALIQAGGFAADIKLEAVLLPVAAPVRERSERAHASFKALSRLDRAFWEMSFGGSRSFEPLGPRFIRECGGVRANFRNGTAMIGSTLPIDRLASFGAFRRTMAATHHIDVSGADEALDGGECPLPREVDSLGVSQIEYDLQCSELVLMT